MNNSREMASLLVLGAFLLASTAAHAGQASSSPPPQADPWTPLRSLLGSWEGDVRGEPGSGRVEREYRLTLNGRFIQVNSQSTYPPHEKNPKGEVHEEIGFISYDKAAKKLVLRQFHIEGFVNHYVLDSISEDGRTIVFVTAAIENIPAGWRGRETYQLVSDDEFVETFALAEPGKDFATYSETRFRRNR
ncbi:MAG TPA: heme-binding beta-barrel domain-containing protein [Vicinamibacteria bacterium]